jgi:hypothetical protein
MDPNNRPKMGTTRREFLTRTGLAVAGTALAGSALAGDTAPKIILGEGSHKFECIHDWLVPPDNIKWGDTQGVAQDRKGNIYISHTVGAGSQSDDAIVVFDKKGKFLKSWGSRFKGGGHGLDIRKEGKQEYLYHCDTAHRLVVKTDLDGAVIWEKGLPTETGVYNDKTPFVPTNVALAPNGDFYVTDGYGSDYIMQYNVKGELLRTFGGKGSEPGKVANAHGIWVDTRGSEPFVAVADRANHRIQYFTMDGKHVKFVDNGMRLPCHFDVRGDMLLVPDLSSVVTVLDGDNKVMVQLGDGASLGEYRGKPRNEWVPGKFIHPHSAKFLQNGDILVVEWVPTGRITLLKKA